MKYIVLKVSPNTIVIDPKNLKNLAFWLTPGGGVNEEEKLMPVGRAWWNKAMLKESNEIFYPKNLVDILDAAI